MRKIALIFGMLLFVTLSLHSQTDNVTMEAQIDYKGPGVIVLNTGEKLIGTVKYYAKQEQWVWLEVEGEEIKRYKGTAVKEFTVNNQKIVLLKKAGLSVLAHLRSEPDYKIQIFEHISQTYKSPGDLIPTIREHYVYFKEHDKLLSMKDIGLTNKKIAVYTKDCEELSKKIASKSKEYKIGMMTPAFKKVKILKAISEAYHNCN